MERKTGTASTAKKEALRIAKVMKQNAMITTRRKNSNSGVTHPEKKAAPCTENRKNKTTRHAPTKVAKLAVPKKERTSL
jgi:hypothetical protein